MLATLAAVVELRGTKLHIFESLSITFISMEQPSSFGKSVIKSMRTVYHGVPGYSKGYYKPAGFWVCDFALWNSTQYLQY